LAHSRVIGLAYNGGGFGTAYVSGIYVFIRPLNGGPAHTYAVGITPRDNHT